MLRTLAVAGTMVVGALLWTTQASAQDWPRKQPVKIVVAANAGGGSDIRARLIADLLTKRIGQAVVVDNRPGAGSMIGADFVAKSPPDGYTLFFTASEFSVLPAMRKQMPYKFEDFTFLMQVFSFQPVMYGSPKLNVSNIPELVAHMKANPGKVRYGTTGVGAVVHLGLAMFEAAAGVKGAHVPYTGIAPVYTDMIGGFVDITQATPPAPEGGIKVLGVVGTKRSPVYPNLPTLDELGIKNASWDIWFGLLAPPNTPRALVDRLNAEIGAMMKDPEALAKFEQIKAIPDVLVGDDFKKAVLAEHEKWKTVIEREKIPTQ